MSATRPEVNERLAALVEAGTSPWLDQIRRSLVEGGELQRMIDELSLRGVTSNPSIFEKAILGSEDYDEDLKGMAEEGFDASEIFRRLSVKDIQLAADVLRPVWEDTDHVDGFVSLEVHPRLARDTAGGTLEEARALWREVDRPNVMIKIPGTSEGLEAIHEATYDGINVNVTLLFSVESYANVTEAWISAMERRHAEGKGLDVHSVASFFVSRVDSKIDKLLKASGHDELLGQAGVANARAAYARFRETFHGERFRALREAGAPVQRPLWASTGVKNPDYPDTMYVDGLVAPETVNTMPTSTYLAAAERAEVSGGATAAEDPTADLQALAEAGIDLEQVTEELLDEGIETFAKSFDSLLAGVESQRESVVVGRPPTIESSIPDELEPAIAERARRAVDEDVARRVWSKDESLWGGPGVPEVGNRLGWLTITETMTEHLGELTGWAEAVRGRGVDHVVLLGMGGSSLGPEVIRRSFETGSGDPELHVLDSTDPGAVRAVEEAIDLERAFFVVSSKSGGTIETLSHFKHFWEKVPRGERFCAVTDPGSPLEAIADRHGFDRVWRNDPDIGGRYSVLSYFGLVPAALMGVAVDGLLHSAQVAEQNCAHHDSTKSNSGLWLGLALGELARQGRDKLTFVVSEPIESFGLWAEQLVAESTGKQGRGILPVADEPLLAPEAYGDDRVFAYLRNTDEPDAELDEKVQALAASGQPTLTFSTQGAPDLGRLFFFSEFAVAVAGWALEINPFDQPNVQEAKDATNEVLKAGDPPGVPSASADELRALLDSVSPPGYVALMGYLPPSEAIDDAVAELRAAIMEKTRAATTFGYGPRFLHSTGQLHKGGPATGHFVQLVHRPPDDEPIPGANYGFATLEAAQALGDLRALEAHGRPVKRIVLEGDPADAIRELAQEVSR